MLKRATDLLLAVPALIVTSPLVAGLAIAVRATSPGEALFAQDRVGRAGRRFRLYKLRTMVRDAQRLGPAVTSANDSRITRLGRVLRSSKLDELPQLWNVVRGDMSVVGPRPEAPEYVEPDDDAWRTIHSVRPGITDLASIAFRNEESLLAEAPDRVRAYRQIVLPAKQRLAEEGIHRSSVCYDFGILLRTAAVVFRVGREHPAVAETRAMIKQMAPTSEASE